MSEIYGIFKKSISSFWLSNWHLQLLKCAQCIKRSNCVVSHKEIEPKTFFSVINIDKTLPKTDETSQPPLDVLPVFNITEKTDLVQFVYVKRRSLLSWHLTRTLVKLHRNFIEKTFAYRNCKAQIPKAFIQFLCCKIVKKKYVYPNFEGDFREFSWLKLISLWYHWLSWCSQAWMHLSNCRREILVLYLSGVLGE